MLTYFAELHEKLIVADKQNEAGETKFEVVEESTKIKSTLCQMMSLFLQSEFYGLREWWLAKHSRVAFKENTKGLRHLWNETVLEWPSKSSTFHTTRTSIFPIGRMMQMCSIEIYGLSLWVQAQQGCLLGPKANVVGRPILVVRFIVILRVGTESKDSMEIKEFVEELI